VFTQETPELAGQRAGMSAYLDSFAVPAGEGR
jgi:hypothetical protein